MLKIHQPFLTQPVYKLGTVTVNWICRKLPHILQCYFQFRNCFFWLWIQVSKKFHAMLPRYISRGFKCGESGGHCSFSIILNSSRASIFRDVCTVQCMQSFMHLAASATPPDSSRLQSLMDSGS